MARSDGGGMPAKVSCARVKENGHAGLRHVAPGPGRVMTLEIPGRMVMWRVRRPRLRWRHVVDIYEGGTPAILTCPEVKECGKAGKCQVASGSCVDDEHVVVTGAAGGNAATWWR